MGNVGLLFVGAVLFMNGLLLLGKVDARSGAVFNLFVGALQVLTPTYLIFTANNDSMKILAASGIFLFGFTYLYDPSQESAIKYGAMFTPECFVLDKNRKVVYMGSFDDKPGGEPKVKFVEVAVTAALAGKPAEMAETSAAGGCKIKFDKKDDE